MDSLDYTVVAYTLGIYIAIVVSPGPNFALVSRLALQGERRKSVGAICGLATAATFYAVLAMIGLSAVLNEVAWLARAVQIAGGAYLIYLGLGSWVSSFGPRRASGPVTLPAASRKRFFSGFRLGLLVNLSNPKAIAFFVGLYAVAVPPDASLQTRLAILAGGALIELIWYNIVVFLLSRPTAQGLYQRFSGWIERMIGTVLIIFGARLVLDR